MMEDQVDPGLRQAMQDLLIVRKGEPVDIPTIAPEPRTCTVGFYAPTAKVFSVLGSIATIMAAGVKGALGATRRAPRPVCAGPVCGDYCFVNNATCVHIDPELDPVWLGLCIAMFTIGFVFTVVFLVLWARAFKRRAETHRLFLEAYAKIANERRVKRNDAADRLHAYIMGLYVKRPA